jgi:hypothetical protein
LTAVWVGIPSSDYAHSFDWLEILVSLMVVLGMLWVVDAGCRNIQWKVAVVDKRHFHKQRGATRLRHLV